MKNIWIIIPALEPEREFCTYLHILLADIPAEAIIVDDGSGPDYKTIFEEIGRIDRCTVLRHSTNLGKGRALKTGLAYAWKKASNNSCFLCADCDGQHSQKDIMRVLKTLQNQPGSMVLGERDFSFAHTPLRSRFGNHAASALFYLACGTWLTDTQTGLRAFDSSLMPIVLETAGDRFEYEMNVLLKCVKKDIPIIGVTIQTIYRNGNEGSHFRPVWDSILVLRPLLSNFVRFGLSSLLCAVLDVWLFWMFSRLAVWGTERIYFWQIAIATIASRVISASANYVLNRSYVFCAGRQKISVLRYSLLCAGLAAASAASVTAVNTLLHLSPAISKILCDTVLFFLSYRLQKNWVFHTKRKDK